MFQPWVAAAVAIAVSNAVALALMGLDKRRAVRGVSRISEASLVGMVFLGALPGLLAGMRLFRHKTRKRSFQLKVAAATVLWLAVIYAILALLFGADPLQWGLPKQP